MATSGAQPTDIIQLALNAGALLASAAVWVQYVNKLKATIASKEAEVSNAEKHRDFWHDKADEFEKRSPEHMEAILSERISIRDREILTLRGDNEVNEETLARVLEEKAALERTLSHTRGYRAMLALETGGDEIDPLEYEEGLFGANPNVEVVKLGDVGVDSGQLMITDPCYIDSEWENEPFLDVRIVDDHSTGQSFQFRTDFGTYSDVLPGYEKSVNELLEEGVLVERAMQRPSKLKYSYRGACAATLTKGYGELDYQRGEAGAGVVFSTAFGDGIYPIYGELRDGRIVRVYVNVA